MITFNGQNAFSGMFAEIVAAGHYCHIVDGAFKTDDDAAVQSIIDAYPLSSAQAEVIAKIDMHAKSLRDGVVASISPAEMANWTIKQAEARAYQASGNEADAPMLGIEATARGVTVADLAAKVLAKAVQLSQLEAMIAGVAGAHGDAVKALGTFDAVLAYDWHTGWPI